MHQRAVDAAAPERAVRFGANLLTAALGAILLAIWAFAFVGLRSSSYWIDELWTVYVIHRPADLAEVFRRTLTDTHPPLYYLAAHLWAGLWGEGEASLRLFSALCAVGAGVVLVAGSGPAFSLPARLFGAAAGASSMQWFFEAQNARNYALGMLTLVALLVCAVRAKRRILAGEPVGWGLCAATAAIGALTAFTHYYLLVATGLVFLWLLLGAPDRRLRLTVLAAGPLILAASVAYIVVQHRSMQWGFWFQKDPTFLLQSAHVAGHEGLARHAKLALILLALGAAFGLFRRRGGAKPPIEPRARRLANWTAALALFVFLGLPAIGLAITLWVTPSLSNRNLLIALPCVWFIAAWLYDQAVGPAPSWRGLALGGAACALLAIDLVSFSQGRFLQRNENWRDSARYVNSLAACHGQPIPVVQPQKMGPPNAFFRTFTERGLYGFYYRGGGRLVHVTGAELRASRRPDLDALIAARASGQDPCPVLAWAVHDMEDKDAASLAQALSQRPDVAVPVVVRRIPNFILDGDRWRPISVSGAYVFERGG